jgi:hypothetical protein
VPAGQQPIHWVKIGSEDHEAIVRVLEFLPSLAEQVAIRKGSRKIAQVGFVLRTTWENFRMFLEIEYERIMRNLGRISLPGIVA